MVLRRRRRATVSWCKMRLKSSVTPPVTYTIASSYLIRQGGNTIMRWRRFAVYPLPTPPAIGIDRWGIDFKSTPISDKVKGLARFAEDRLPQELFNLFHKIPETSSMAGWIFELIAHRLLSGGWQRWDVSIPPPIPMDSLESDEESSPLFTDSPIGTSPVRVGQRTIVRPKDRELKEVTLEGNRCCIPTASTNPLFDSFTVDFDRNLHTVVISILQITSQTQT